MNYIETYTGQQFSYANIDNNVIDIKDIAWSLSHTNRYNGHTSEPWSVAQHSLLVADLVSFDEELMRYALLHDASEAYLGDLAGPLKQFCPDFKRIEERVEHHIYRSFGMIPKLSPAVKYADLQALGVEKQHFMNDVSEWECLEGVEIPTMILRSMPPRIVYSIYMKAW